MAEQSAVGFLRPSLQKLVQQIRFNVEQWRDSGELVISTRRYTRRPDLSLQYSVDPTFNNDAPLEHGEEEIWDYTNLERFCREKIEPSAAYQYLLNETAGIQRANQHIRGFIRRVACDFRLPYIESTIQDCVDIVLRDIGELDQDFVARIWLTGIEPKEQLIQVSERLSFRKPRREDMQERVLDEAVHFAHAFHWPTTFSCIAELHVSAPRPLEVQIEVDRLITALRLFRLGAVSAPRIDFSAESFSPFSNGRSGSPSGAARVEYELSQSDAVELARFLRTVTPSLPTPYGLPKQEPDFLSTAFDWYADALLATKPIEGTLASAVACLEALFLGDNPKTEITNRLVQRVAAMLGRYGWPSLQIRKMLLGAYDVRSRYVHGSVPSRKKLTHQQLGEMFRVTAEYARLGCLIFVQMVNTHKKEHIHLLRALDDALIDDVARDELSKWCSIVDFGHNRANVSEMRPEQIKFTHE